jgi:hypothetical protein
MSSSFLRSVSMLTVSGLIYSFTDPEVGFNNRSIVLFVSFLLAVAVATYVYDGLQVLVAERRFNLESSIHLFPMGILVAVICVIVSRVAGLHPGVFYGFVAAAVIVAARSPSRSEEARIIYYPMLALIGVALFAWLLIDPFRAMAEDGSFLGAVLEGVAVATFLGGIQGSLFNLIPIQFMDGIRVWRWSKLAWIAVFLPLLVLFLQVIVEQGETMESATDNDGIRALFLIAVVFWVVTAGTWLFFRIRASRQQATA